MPERPRTSPETPLPLAIARAQTLGEVEADVEWIKEALRRIEAKPHVCVQDAAIARIEVRHRIVNALLAAIALAVLGSFGLVLGTCQATSHAAGVNETRIENHSARLGRLESSLEEMNKAREADTLRILEAIRGRGQER